MISVKKCSNVDEVDTESVMKELLLFHHNLGWSGDAKVLGKLPVPGRPSYLDESRARAYCACSRCGWVLFGHFSLVYHFFLAHLSTKCLW